MINRLHTLQVFQHAKISQLAPHQPADLSIGRRQKLNVVHVKIDFTKGLNRCLLGFEVIGMWGEYGEFAVFSFHVGDTHSGFHQRFQYRLFIVMLEHEDRQVIEAVADGAFGADLSFGEGLAHVAEGAVRVVAQVFDDGHSAIELEPSVSRGRNLRLYLLRLSKFLALSSLVNADQTQVFTFVPPKRIKKVAVTNTGSNRHIRMPKIHGINPRYLKRTALL